MSNSKGVCKMSRDLLDIRFPNPIAHRMFVEILGRVDFTFHVFCHGTTKIDFITCDIIQHFVVIMEVAFQTKCHIEV